jgi:hypothetical protein
MRKPSAVLAIAAVSVLFLALAAVPADADTAVGGKASIKLDPGLYRTLQREGIEMRGRKGARVRGGVVTLSLSDGVLSSADGSGRLLYDGGIELAVGQRAIVLNGFVLDTEKGRLTAHKGQKRLMLAVVRGVKSQRQGFGVRLVVKDLNLTAEAAHFLNHALGITDVFHGGWPFADISAGVRFLDLTATGGTIYFFFDPAFRTKLESLGVEVLTFEATETYAHTLPGFAIPGVGGSLARDLSTGALTSSNGLRLVQGGSSPMGEVDLLGISLSFEAKTAFADIRNQPSGTGGVAPLATVAFSTVHANPTTGVISIPETKAALSPNLADALNATFGAPKGQPSAFSEGESLGTFAFVVQTR